MNSSWWPSNSPGHEPPGQPSSSNGWPTSSSSRVNNSSHSGQPSPRRREHAQPPPLTTALSGHQFQGLGVGLGPGYASTPLSTTSLSSPFTQNLSPAVTTPGGAVGSPPMASRQYNVPYNPQDWGPVSGAGPSAYPPSNSMLRVVSQSRQAGGHPDMSLSPPPPPYSPPAQPQQQQLQQQQREQPPRGSASPVVGSSYHAPGHENSDPHVEYRQQPLPRTRPLSMVGDPRHNRQVSLPPPPPLPQAVPSSRSSSHNRADVYGEQQSGINSRPYITVSPDHHHQQSPPSSYQHMHTAQVDDSRPPASRRAVSAGPVVSSAGSSRAPSQSRSGSPAGGSGWEPGMPLPPPPPGPPPPASRSHSVSGMSENVSSLRSSSYHGNRTARRPPPVSGTSLESIPPTPAGWVDEGPSEPSQKDKTQLHVNTREPHASPEASNIRANDAAQSSTPGGLFRTPAIRDASAKGIRERRIERRNRQSQVIEDLSAVSMSSNPWAEALDQVKPSNLVLNHSNDSPDHSRHPPSSKFTPRSSHSNHSDGLPTTTRSRASSIGLFSNRSNRSSFSTPRPEPSPLGPGRSFAQTPPFSPDGDKSSSFSKTESSQALPPRALPTPPLQSGRDSRPPSRPASREDRPVSHLLHMPNETVPTAPPLSPRRAASHRGNASLNAVVNRDVGFVQNAVQRHKDFIEKEAAAADEAEALKIFTEFLIAESQIRRARYAQVWNTGSPPGVDDVRRRLFEPAPPKAPVDAPAPGGPAAAPAPLQRRPSRGVGAPKLDIPQSRPESAWWNNYKPCLSPIASLNMSNDEMSSRGRAPSRWWESHSSSEGGDRRVERSKRESKYMGLPREALHGGGGPADAGHPSEAFNGNGDQYAYGEHEYPPEKVGWHEEHDASDYSSTVGHSNYHSEAQKMDVSRLITLPPPYPRHHPAVNNSHPDLVTYRTLVRSISELSDIKSTRQRHDSEIQSLRQGHQERIAQGRRHFKANIQSQIEQGSITFAEAAEAEAALGVEENALARALAKQELTLYQEKVMDPLHLILTDRINKASACIDELRSKLFDDAQRETPDQTQEEGDEKPELLEKLTQLKWLFEAREQLHRELYDLVSARDEKYKAVVLLPYQQKKTNTNPNIDDHKKVRDTTAFFAKDALARRATHDAASLARLESFHAVIEENVLRGVESQLSAFWDIAPSLLALVQQIPPDRLAGFQIQIPPTEYEENPSYRAHPLQYLYSLLAHAEKSSYQFIESQINLFCLLHEVKSAVMRANCKLVDAEAERRLRSGNGDGNGESGDRVTTAMLDEERALTNDLKDKVATVEGQWTEALGSQIGALKERVREQLERENGWEDLERLEVA